MKKEYLKSQKIPTQPGVYIFRQGRKILYIGKAASLRDRIRSYFNDNTVLARGPKIETMRELATAITWQETDSVLEALMLEAELIKTHQPKYNSRDKDDKSFWQVIITKEAYPRVLMVRSRQLATDWDPDEIESFFGPFPSANELKVAIKLIRRIFPFRDKCQPKSGKPCFNRQLGLCPGVCNSEITQVAYRRIIRQLKLFFAGQKQTLLKTLNRQMKQAAVAGRFEEAASIRDRLSALRHIQDIALLKRDLNQASQDRIEAYDIAHLSGSQSVGGLVVINDGQPAKNWYRRFIIKDKSVGEINDPAHLGEIIRRRLKHQEWPKPNLVIVDGGKAQIKSALREVKKANLAWPVLGVVKDDRHRPKDIIDIRGVSQIKNGKLSPQRQTAILLAAAEVHRFTLDFHRKKRKIVV